MFYSQLFPKTLKQAPTGSDSINQQLLVRGGFIHQEMAGVYTYLPLGWRVLNKISQIVRDGMDKIGGQELLMPALQPAEVWKKTGRWASFDVLFKLKGAGEIDLVLGPTHEEIIYPLVSEYIKSYKDLPIALYQIQTKFRNEPRAKAGLLRGREFLMKDLYSFHSSDEDRDKYYETVRIAYLEIFSRLGLPVVKTQAAGGTFSSLSEEFQAITPSGEDTVYICKSCGEAVNQEIFDVKKCVKCGGEFEEKKAIEVGNIFPLKRSFAETFGVYFADQDGEKKIVSVGCYGLGISRTMGAIVEVFHDEKGIVWPENIAPFQVHLVGLDLEDEPAHNLKVGISSCRNNKKVKSRAEEIYKQLESEGIEVLFDERVNLSAGEKFADADLIGIPWRVVVSKRTLSTGSGQADKLEVKKRNEKNTTYMTIEGLLAEIQKDIDVN